MAINPPSDIVLDVARAADPLKLQAAALRLTGAVDDEGSGFADVVDGLGSSARSGPGLTQTPGLALQTDFGAKGPQLAKSAAMSGPAMKPYRDFEAFVLQSFIQSMLPSQAESVFGQGVAGEMWKGMLADQLGKELARGGGIGIAASIYKSHPNAAKTPGLSRSTFGAAAAATMSFPASMQTAPTPASPAARAAMLSPMDISPAAAGGASTSERTP